MRNLTVALLVAAFAANSWGIALYGDLNPAAWRGQEGTTFQAWGFGTLEPSNVAPDVSDNPYGTPVANIIGAFFDNTVWLDEDMGHEGVWVIDMRDQSDMVFDIDNSDVPNPVKHIWVQIVFSALEDRVPTVYVLPEGEAQPPIDAMDLVAVTRLDDYYMHATYSLTIEPNPTFEQIRIRPRDCQVYIDEVIIETQCIPEPMSLSLLGLGAVALLRKRR